MAQLICEPKTHIISTSQLPQRMAGAQARINEIEAPRLAPEEAPEPQMGPPRFVTQLKFVIFYYAAVFL